MIHMRNLYFINFILFFALLKVDGTALASGAKPTASEPSAVTRPSEKLTPAEGEVLKWSAEIVWEGMDSTTGEDLTIGVNHQTHILSACESLLGKAMLVRLTGQVQVGDKGQIQLQKVQDMSPKSKPLEDCFVSYFSKIYVTATVKGAKGQMTLFSYFGPPGKPRIQTDRHLRRFEKAQPKN